MNFLRVKRLHFVGIGGIGMSGIARILLDMDYNISGSDVAPNGITRKLEEAGVFDMNKELEMPLVPQKIAIISSPTAAGGLAGQTG